MRTALFALCATCSAVACGAPQAVEVHAGFRYFGAQARDALYASLPAGVQRQVGSVLPDPWPATQPQLLRTLALDQEARADLSGASVYPALAGTIRVRGLRAAMTAPPKLSPGVGTCSIDGCGLLKPGPTELRFYFKPQAADRNPGLSLLGRGSFLADGVQRELVLDAGAVANLETAVRTGALDLVAEARLQFDSARDPAAPRGNVSVDCWIELELVP